MAWQPTPVFLPADLHGQSSLDAESEMTEVAEHAHPFANSPAPQAFSASV